MKNLKRDQRIIATILTAIMLIGAMPLVSLAEKPIERIDEAMALSLTDTTGIPGESVKVSVNIAANPGITSLKFKVEYDSMLTLTNVEFNNDFGGMVTAPKPYLNPQPITMISPLTEISENGLFATFTFEIDEEAADGYCADINIIFAPEDIFNSQETRVPLSVSGGKVTVVRGLPGDVNSDGNVNTKDAILLFRHVSEWDVDVDPSALDVNGDSFVNTKDAVTLFQYVAGWEGIVLHRNPSKHNHVLAEAEAKAATCTEDGNVEYFYCTVCGKYYTDISAETEIKAENIVIPAIKHSTTNIAANNATCTEDGNIAYWYCKNCETFFTDAECQNVVEQTEVIVPAFEHTLTKFEAEGADCTNGGHITYWHCEVCEKNYSDETAENEISIEDTVVSPTGHKLQHTDANAATCTEDGNVEYWYCLSCEKYFADSEAKEQIEKASIVIPAAGHGEHLQHVDAKDATVDEKGNIEYWVCSECGKYYSDEAARNEFSKADTVIDIVPSYTITFIDEKNTPKFVKVKRPQNEETFLTDFIPSPVVGYEFVGWSKTMQVRVYKNEADIPLGIFEGYIPENNTESFPLYAHWMITTYKITLKDAPSHSESVGKNIIQYTIEDEVELPIPEWSGLSFKYWSDSNGNVVDLIEKGTTGNITAYANWMYDETMAVPSNDTSVKAMFFDEETDRFYFIYDLGIIDNVVLKKMETLDKDVGQSIKWTAGNTTSALKETADTVAKSTSTSISQTNEWSENRQLAIGQSVSTTLTSGIELKDIAKIEASLGISTSLEATEEFGRGGAYAEGYEESQEVSSTVSYSTESSFTTTTEQGVSESMPKGTYHLACVGKVRVYAVVIYNPVEQNYYLETYSVLEPELRGKVLYDVPSNCTANISYSEGLPYNIPFFERDENGNLKKDENGNYIPGDIINHLNSCYSIQYNANEGNGKMYTSVHEVGKTEKLSENLFTRDGYIFIGWALDPDGAVVYPNNAEITDVAAPNSVLRLYAVWDFIPYTASWNEGVGYSIKVERASSDNATAPIGVLGSGDYVYYGDILKVTYTNATGYHFTSQGSNTIVVTGNVDSTRIYAHTSLNNYIVVFNANGGTGVMSSQGMTYGASTKLSANEFTRHGWVFAGWKDEYGNTYTDKQLVLNLTTVNNGVFYLFAQWEIISTNTFNFGSHDFDIGAVTKDFSHHVKLTDHFNLIDLANNGYSSIHVTFKYNIQVDGDHLKTESDGSYGYLMSNGLINNVDKVLYDSPEVKMDHNAYQAFNYSGSTSMANILNNEYICHTIWIKAWGGLDFLNKGTISGITIIVTFTK